MPDRQVEPFEVAQLVETFATAEHFDAAEFSNREPLDESGIFNLHTLAAKIYALGFNEGTRTEGLRQTERRDRARQAGTT